MFRRFIALNAILMLCTFFSACASKPNPGITAKAKLEVGESSVFTDAEICSAMDCVLAKFLDFEGCELTRLWYDEECSETFFNHNGGTNQIMILSDFSTDSTHGYWFSDSGFEPDTAYTGWQWSLIRESPGEKWQVKDWGYG